MRLCHAIDHLKRLDELLGAAVRTGVGWTPPASFGAGAKALAVWLDASKDPATAIPTGVFEEISSASSRLSADRKTEREKILESVARQQTTVANGDERIEALLSADRALYHSWRLIDSLRIASQN